jgi:hypothetical protein
MAHVKGSFLTKGRGEVNSTFFEYSNSNGYIIELDIVEYDTRKMAKPAFNLILGVDSLSKLGIVLDFQTKTITVDESILSMQNIDNICLQQLRLKKHGLSTTALCSTNHKAHMMPPIV